MKTFKIITLLILASGISIVYGQNVGVGTTTPLEKLHVAGTFRVDDLQTAAASAAATDKVVWVDANGKIYSLPVGLPGRVLGINGAGFLSWVNPGLATTLNNGQIWVGDATNTATPQTPSGDALISNTGVITIQDNAVDGTDISITGESNGSLMYFNGTNWINLAIGSPGQVLVTSGGGPTWVNANTLYTAGDLTSSTSGVTISGGTGAVLGGGTTVNVATNAINQNGLVTGPTIANANQVWGTNALGNPGWITPVLNDWHITGNTGTNPTNNFLGTLDAQDLAFRVNNSEKMRLLQGNASNGLLGVGVPSLPAATFTGIDPFATIMATGNGLNHGDITIATASNSSFCGYWVSAKARGTLTAPTLVANGDNLDVKEAWGYDGTQYLPSAGIYTFVDGVPGANDMPTAMTFYTRTDGVGGAFSERMRITNAGQVGIGTSTPDASAIMQVLSTNRGVLFPNVALTATNAAGPITLPATSLLVYNTATAGVAPNNVSPGYYYNAGTGAAPNWRRILNGTEGWSILGNAGTTPATNFIGTTDAQDFVVKTSGSAAGNERMRIIGAGATPGQVVINNTGIFAGDVFSVYTSNSTNGTTPSINNTVGTFAINGYSVANGTGVYGETNQGAAGSGSAVWGNLYGTSTSASSTSEGVWGTNAAPPAGTGVTAAVATGVRGEASANAGTAFTMGVLGVNTAVSGSAFGVYGQTSSPNAMGVFGTNLDISGSPAHGVQGQTAATGSAAGVRGFNTATAVGAGQNGFGVRGSANASPTGSGFVMGVRGDCSGATGATYGVYGQVASANGFGMDAVNTNTAGTGLLVLGNNTAGTFLTGGSGEAVNGNAIGSFAIAKTAASGVGVVAVGNNLTANITVPASGAGIAATGTQYGVMGFATTTVNTNPSNSTGGNGVNASAGGYFEVQAAGVAQTWAYVGVRDNGAVLRKIIGPGTVNTIVKDTKGDLVALSCPETPENLFQDYGQGQLVNGKAHIEIDPIFAKNIVVNTQHPLRVFVQLEGNCQGVYVANKSQFSFDVVELNGGSTNVPFSYTIVANRADEVLQDGSISHYSAERFAPAPGPQAHTFAETITQSEELSKALLSPQDAPVELPVNIQKTIPKKTTQER